MVTRILKELQSDLNNLKNVSHHLNDNNLNPYHLEGDVYSHTMMVLNNLLRNISHPSTELILAVLLHDVGKSITRFVKDDKVYFTGHEGVGFYMANDILKRLEEKFKFDRLKVLKLILGHNLIYINKWHHLDYEDFDFIADMLELISDDRNGRITTIERKFKLGTKKKLATPKEDKEVIIMCAPAGAGKSTYIKNNLKDYFVVSRDEIVEEYGRKKYGNMDYVDLFRKIRENNEQLLIDEFLNEKIKESKNYNKVVIDMTNVANKRQKQFVHSYSKWNRKLVVLNPGFNEIMKRNNSRKIIGKKINEDIIIDMMKKFIYPNTNWFHNIEWVID